MTSDAEKAPDAQEKFGDDIGAKELASQEIPTSEPILPPLPSSVHLPMAWLLDVNEPTDPSEQVVGEESDDDLIREIRASTPPCEYNHGEKHKDDPQLTLGNLKKFQEISKSSPDLLWWVISRILPYCVYNQLSLMLFVVSKWPIDHIWSHRSWRKYPKIMRNFFCSRRRMDSWKRKMHLSSKKWSYRRK